MRRRAGARRADDMQARVTQLPAGRSRTIRAGPGQAACACSYSSANVVVGSGANEVWMLQALHTSSSSASSTEKTTSSPHPAQSRRMFMTRTMRGVRDN